MVAKGRFSDIGEARARLVREARGPASNGTDDARISQSFAAAALDAADLRGATPRAQRLLGDRGTLARVAIGVCLGVSAIWAWRSYAGYEPAPEQTIAPPAVETSAPPRAQGASSTTLDDFAAAFDQRLAAIARTHSLLSRTESADVKLREVLTQELSAHSAVESENVALGGPEIRLGARQAQVLAMAFHEPATNAVKHGALSAQGGRINVAWEILPSNEQVRIRWQESGVAIGPPPNRREYGSEILERAIPHMLHGSFERTFDPEGLQCLISFAPDRGRGGGRRDRN